MRGSPLSLLLDHLHIQNTRVAVLLCSVCLPFCDAGSFCVWMRACRVSVRKDVTK